MDVTPCQPERASEVIELLAGKDVATERRAELAAELVKTYFENPWTDPELTPLICTVDERVVGFLGITPRVMRYGDRTLRVAVSSNFTVAESAPDKHRPFIAARMIKTMINGPQDLSLADGATDVSRRIWQRCGGQIAPVMGLDWFHTARPARGVWELARRGFQPSSFADSTAKLGAGMLDLVGAPLAKRLAKSNNATVALDRDNVITAINEDVAAPLKPEARPDWLDWLLDRTSRLAVDGRVRGGIVERADSAMAGWYIYILSSDRVADVLQLDVTRGDPEDILGACIMDARKAGAALIRGHARMTHLAAYRRHFCLLNSGRWFLAHSREPDLLRPLMDGTAWVSMLDGERWIGNFQT
ncbi:MAG: hypothetical protein AAFY56_13500 [Pseudomonadota bacterium]